MLEQNGKYGAVVKHQNSFLAQAMNETGGCC
jgi:hypothetical protein